MVTNDFLSLALSKFIEISGCQHCLSHFLYSNNRRHAASSKYLWWNTLAQVERFQDCSGKNTSYRFDERHHLVAVTDALGQTTTLERKPDGEVLRIHHPDGSAESFTYNALGQVLTHTDGKGQTTRLLRTARGLPSSRQDAKGQRIRYEYDPAIRLTALINENNAAYQFAYDASDRLIEEKRIDNLTRRFSYNLGGHLTQVDETGYGERGERPQRRTEFERDSIGRLLAKLNADARQDYVYDDAIACCRSSACRPRRASKWVSAKKRWNSPTTCSAA